MYDIGDLEEIEIARLLDEGTIRAEDVSHLESLNISNQKSRLQALNQFGVLADETLADAYHRMTGLDIIEPSDLPSQIDEEDRLLNPEFLKHTKALLISKDGPLVVVHPTDLTASRAAEFVLGFAPKTVIARSGDWVRAYNQIYEEVNALSGITDQDLVDQSADLSDQDRDAPIVRRVSTWLSDAADRGASDIHFDARRNGFEVRYRVDGILRLVAQEPRSAAASVIARIKVLAGLDLGERFRSQDGRATIVVRGRRLDVRVSVIATIDGESAVVRLLDRPAGLLSLDSLGFQDEVSHLLREMMMRRNGLFIVAGPTGSGKTTTLYACLEYLKGAGLKILSVEDPVEYHFEHVNQVQVSDQSGRGFADALRAFLRHDPDVILVGEIRDSETAKIAVEAALQGHLVLATLHAIDVARVETRLLDMGVEPFQLAATLNGAMAQRLVRYLCPSCREAYHVTQSEAELFQADGLAVPDSFYAAKGCAECRGEGFAKRGVLGEIELKGGQSRKTATMKVQGLKMAANAETTLSEIMSLDVR
ncbi:MAG: GspE/PulE family protein [Pseudomonadota bacterium]